MAKATTNIKETSEAEKIAQLVQFGNYKSTKIFRQFVRLPHKIKGLFPGNQSMKTSATAFQYVLRIFGTHPVAKFNVLYFECEKRAELFAQSADHEEYYRLKEEFLKSHKSIDSPTFNRLKRPDDNMCPECFANIIIHKRKTRIFRFASETLPTEKTDIHGDTMQSAEINNTQYPEFKKWLPAFIIKKDITVRNPALTLIDPNGNKDFGGLKYVGADIMVEFVSYNQSVQAGAGVQRLSVWEDEEAPLDFHEEQLPRLLGEDGDVIITVTPANGLTWTYDDIFEKAALYLRTPTICKYYKEHENKEVKEVERTDSNHDIAVIQAATDDNPTLSPDVVNDMYKEMPDLDGTAIATRRYGIFKQATGRIFKDMNYNIHVIKPEVYGIGPEFINGCVLARTMDFHPSNPHALIWAAMSQTNELFICREWNPSPDKWVLSRLCKRIATLSENQKYVCNLVDPLANILNTGGRKRDAGKSSIELMNEYFMQLRREGIGTGGYWEPYNTKGEVGRDTIKERLANSVKCETPFNNEVVKDGLRKHIPTIWIFNDCRLTARSLKQWRLESWASNRQLATKDRKESPSQKWSHFCTALEGLLKDKRFRAKRVSMTSAKRSYRKFQGKTMIWDWKECKPLRFGINRYLPRDDDQTNFIFIIKIPLFPWYSRFYNMWSDVVRGFGIFSLSIYIRLRNRGGFPEDFFKDGTSLWVFHADFGIVGIGKQKVVAKRKQLDDLNKHTKRFRHTDSMGRLRETVLSCIKTPSGDVVKKIGVNFL